MKISIIIPTLNSAQTIRETMDTIITQTHSDFECIIVDEGSTDSTLQIIKEYQSEDNRIYTLEDQSRNLYLSINKGIESSSGDIITILNSDNFYNENTVLENVALSFEKEGMDVCYGDLLIVNRENTSKIIRYWKSGSFNPKNINSGWAPPHPTLFITKETYNQIGLYNPAFDIAGEYECMLRLMRNKELSFSYIPKILVRMRADGIHNLSIRAHLTRWKNLRNAWKINGLKVPFLFITRRVLSKISQYF